LNAPLRSSAVIVPSFTILEVIWLSAPVSKETASSVSLQVSLWSMMRMVPPFTQPLRLPSAAGMAADAIPAPTTSAPSARATMDP